MTVTVGIGYWRCPDQVERAVRSVLEQTHRDLRVVVIGDGEDAPLSIADPRLTVYRLPQNRGAYFALQLILQAVESDWFAPMGADDWLDPDHLEATLAVGGDAIGAGSVWIHDGPTVEERPKAKGWEVGAFRRERLLAIGGYNPAERLGQDTLLLRLLARTGRLAVTERPTYHRLVRPESLSNAFNTNARSVARRQARSRNRQVLAITAGMRAHEIAAARARRIPPSIAHELALHAERLRDQVGGPP